MRLLQRRLRHFIGITGLAVAALIWVGCKTAHQPLPPPPPPNPAQLDTIPMQKGDQMFVDLTGTPQPIPQLSFTLSGTGSINLPQLPTNIIAIGKSPHELETLIRDLYVQMNVFKQIAVTVTPGQRYYYVSGQINNISQTKQLYTGRVTVLGAISAAGGFNEFAARKRVQLTRQDGTIFIVNCNKALKDPRLDLEVFPGDRIFVDQETFWEAFGHIFGN
jgi:protein involved in polysaccharide export with SLBB domain